MGDLVTKADIEYWDELIVGQRKEFHLRGGRIIMGFEKAGTSYGTVEIKITVWEGHLTKKFVKMFLYEKDRDSYWDKIDKDKAIEIYFLFKKEL